MRKLSTDLIKSGSFTGSFSGSVIGTITSASYASTSSYVVNGFSLTTGSTYSITSSWSNNSISSSFSRNSISSSYANTSSNLSPVAQDLIPFTSSTYSLGSPSNKWKDLYVSTGSIYIGEVVLSTSGSTLYADVQPIVTLNTASGQIQVSGLTASISASFSNTSSIALNAISSSYSLSGSYAKNSDISQTSTSASYSNTSSVALNAISSSYGLTSSYSFFANNANSSSTSTSASYSLTSSVALNALTSSYINVATNAVSSSFASTASISVSSSFAVTSSYNLNSISSSYSLTASFAANAGSSLTTGSTYPITSSWATTSSNIIGGTSNYIPLWSTNTSLGNSVLYQNISNIGIGTTSPADKLHIAVGNISVDAGYRYYMDANIGAASIRKSGSSMVFSVGSSDRVYVDGTGAFGIGTNPTAKLDIYDDTNQGHQILVRNNNAGSSAYSALILQRNAAVNGLVLFTNSSTRTTDGGAGNSTIRTDNGKLLLGAGGTTYHAIDTNGNVGIGTTSPNSKLEVVGNISASAFTGSHFGTSSWANNVVTASYVVNSVSSSYALTASYALNAGSGGSSSSSTSSIIGQTFVPTASVSQLSLTQSVSNNDQILVILDGLVQSRTGSYTVTGSTLNLTENAESGSNIDVRFLGGSSVSSSYAVTASYALTKFTECVHLASTVSYTLPNANIVIVPFNTAVILENITINATASTVNGIEAYHWRHSSTGIFRLVYQVRATTDAWNMISVCRNNNTALPVGNGYRSGAPAGQWGILFECLYRVTDTSDRFGLFHWSNASTGTQAAHSSGNPPSTFFVTPDVGTAPTTGYYNSITITKI